MNTLLTGGLFYVLAFVVPTLLAYTIAFTLGIVFTAILAPRFVFLTRPSVSRRALYAVWYLIVYVIGLACVRVLDEVAHADHLHVVGLTVVLTAVLGFVGGRVILTRPPQGEQT